MGQWEEQAREAAVASLFEEQQTPRGNALLGQLSFSQQKSFCWSSQVVKPEEDLGPRRSGWGRGGGGRIGQQPALNQALSPRCCCCCTNATKSGRISPLRLGLPASTWAERGRVVLLVGRRLRSSRLVELAVAHTLSTTTSCCRGFQLRGTEASGPGLASPASVASPEAEDRQRGRQHHARALWTSPNQPTPGQRDRGWCQQGGLHSF